MSAKVSAKMSALSEADRALVEAASDAIRKRYRYDWQEVGAALRTRSGKVFTGVSLDAYLGRLDSDSSDQAGQKDELLGRWERNRRKRRIRTQRERIALQAKMLQIHVRSGLIGRPTTPCR